MTLFFVVMPLVVATYWLADAGHHMFDRRGTWVRAACTVLADVTFVSEVYHTGRIRGSLRESPRAEGARKGWELVIERAWNVSVVTKAG